MLTLYTCDTYARARARARGYYHDLSARDMPPRTIAHVHLTLNCRAVCTRAAFAARASSERPRALDTPRAILIRDMKKMNLFYASAARLNKKRERERKEREKRSVHTSRHKVLPMLIPLARATFQLVNCGRRLHVHAHTPLPCSVIGETYEKCSRGHVAAVHVASVRR